MLNSQSLSYQPIIDVLGTSSESREFKTLSQYFGEPKILFDNSSGTCTEFYTHGLTFFLNKTGNFYERVIFHLEGESTSTYERKPCDMPLPFGIFKTDTAREIKRKICYSHLCPWRPSDDDLNAFINKRMSPSLKCSIDFDTKNDTPTAITIAVFYNDSAVR